MDDQVFADGIGVIMAVGGTVRLDLVTYSATETDAKGRPTTAFRQRIVFSTEGFLQAAEKIREAAAAVSPRGTTESPRIEPIATSEVASNQPVRVATVQPAVSAPPAKVPFP